MKYTPPTGYTGPGSFTYQAHDGPGVGEHRHGLDHRLPGDLQRQTVGDADGPTTGRSPGSPTPRPASATPSTRTPDSGRRLDFIPDGAATVAYRGSSPSPLTAPVGPYPLLLRYDPTGGTGLQAGAVVHQPAVHPSAW